MAFLVLTRDGQFDEVDFDGYEVDAHGGLEFYDLVSYKGTEFKGRKVRKRYSARAWLTVE